MDARPLRPVLPTPRGDTFHLVLAGLMGGMNVPSMVGDRSRFFVTLTAPFFGPVHRSGG
ncbi:replication initiator [Streptomyces sp. NPDC090032]|uniref:replication initiator n=1 Tax=Streptomyces sp. NPDC090032 TaxID=3365925 RepID=UPI00381B82AC